MSRLPASFRVLLVFAIGVMLGVGLAVGPSVKAEREPPSQAAADNQDDAPATQQPVPWKDARLLAEVLEHVRQEYVDKVSDQELIEAAIRGMMSDLDPHSAFLDPEEFDEMRISTSAVTTVAKTFQRLALRPSAISPASTPTLPATQTR